MSLHYSFMTFQHVSTCLYFKISFLFLVISSCSFYFFFYFSLFLFLFLSLSPPLSLPLSLSLSLNRLTSKCNLWLRHVTVENLNIIYLFETPCTIRCQNNRLFLTHSHLLNDDNIYIVPVNANAEFENVLVCRLQSLLLVLASVIHLFLSDVNQV